MGNPYYGILKQADEKVNKINSFLFVLSRNIPLLKVRFHGNTYDLQRMRISEKWQSPTFVF